MFISTLTLRNVDYLRIVAVMLLFALSLASANVMADDDEIDIDKASWSDRRDRLTVEGDKVPRNATVTIRYGEKDDNGAVIGTTRADDDGDWEFRISVRHAGEQAAEEIPEGNAPEIILKQPASIIFGFFRE